MTEPHVEGNSLIPRDYSDGNLTQGNILIPRDYSDGNLTQFSDKFPPDLETLGVDQESFQQTISTINGYFEQAETVGCKTFVEGCVGCLSFFTLYLCWENHYSRVMGELALFLTKENKKYSEWNVEWKNPLQNGLLHLEILHHADSDEAKKKKKKSKKEGRVNDIENPKSRKQRKDL